MERKIEGYNYTVDDMGNVYNALGKKLRLRPNTSGYPQVILCKNGKMMPRCVHNLVMEAFVGPKPKGYDTDHINFDRADNRLENLRYVPTHWNRGYGKKRWVGTHFYNET